MWTIEIQVLKPSLLPVGLLAETHSIKGRALQCVTRIKAHPFLPDVFIRVIDLFTIKPLDAATIISNAKATGGMIITVEDHYAEGMSSVSSGLEDFLGGTCVSLENG